MSPDILNKKHKLPCDQCACYLHLGRGIWAKHLCVSLGDCRSQRIIGFMMEGRLVMEGSRNGRSLPRMGVSPQTPRLCHTARDYTFRRASLSTHRFCTNDFEKHNAMVILEVVSHDFCEIPPHVSGSPGGLGSLAVSWRGIPPRSGSLPTWGSLYVQWYFTYVPRIPQVLLQRQVNETFEQTLTKQKSIEQIYN